MNASVKYLCVEAEEISTVPHPIAELAVSPSENFLLAYSLQGAAVSLFTTDRLRKEINLPDAARSPCLCISSDGKHLAYINEGRLQLVIRDVETGRAEVVPHQSEVVDAKFDDQGRVWTVRKEEHGFVVEIRNPLSWDLLSSAKMSDSYFAQGGAVIRAGSAADAMYIAAYSGQSEQENYLCMLDGQKMSARHLAEMDGDQFVFACPKGRTLTLDHIRCEIAVFAQDDQCISRIGWPDYVEGEAEDERPGYYGCYLDENHFLAGSQEGRLFIVQLSPLCVLSEIAVLGFEPVPFAAKYPSLSGILGSGSDLCFFARCGSYVYTFFAADYRSPSQQLALLGIPDLLKAAQNGE